MKDFREGFTANLPLAVSVAAYGVVLGVLASQKQISWLELVAMNISVFAGSAQFIMVEMWIPPLPILEIAMAVLAINLRYLLIGASLEPIFRTKSLAHKLLRIHLVADENWAVTMARFRNKGYVSTDFLLGGGLCIFSAWSFGTLSGCFFGALIKNPSLYGLDFAFAAVFTALATSFWRGKKDIVPWILSALVAVGVEAFVPGKWYVIAGALAGSLSGVLLWKRSDKKGSPCE